MRKNPARKFAVFVDLESYEHGSITTNASGPVSAAKAREIERKLERVGKYRGRRILDIYVQGIAHESNPKKALGRRFKVGDSVHLRGDYNADSAGIIIKQLPGKRIRVDYPARGVQLDAKVSEFMPVRRHKRRTKTRRRRNPSVTQGESESGFKYSSKLSEYLHSQAMDGPDKEIGSVDELGWFGFLSFKDDPLVVMDDNREFTYKAAIVAEYNDGSTDYETYDKLSDANLKWRELEKKYSKFYRWGA